MAIVSVEVLARACNLTPRRIQQLVQEGMPREDRGAYDLGVCMSWYIRFLQEELAKRGPGAQAGVEMEQMRAQKRRLVELQADEKELDLQQARRKLIPIKHSLRLLERVLDRLRAQILNMPGKYAGRVVGVMTMPEAQARLEAISDDLLLDLQTAGTKDEDDPMDDELEADDEGAAIAAGR